VFCGSTAALTAEHAWPDWALSHIRRRRPGKHTITSQRYGAVHTQWSGTPELTVRILCDTCNHDRLGSIEDEVAPTLKPLTDGQPRLVLRPSVALIALWTIKTAMVFEFTADKARQPFYTFEERRDLALDRRIPDKTSALVARYVGSQHMFDHGRDLVLTPADGGVPYHAFVSTVAIGQFVGQAITHRSTERPAAEIAKAGESLVKQIWPSPRNLIWPMKTYLDDEALLLFARSGDESSDFGAPLTPPP
jgi:hypothetical protein